MILHFDFIVLFDQLWSQLTKGGSSGMSWSGFFEIKHRLTIAYHPVPSYQETQDKEVFGKDNWRGPCALQVQDPELPSDSWNGSGISTAFSTEASSTFSDYTLTKLR